MDRLNEIKKELLSNPEVVKTITLTPPDDMFVLHFGLGMYIRNTYLWHDHELVAKLSQHYKVGDVDDISLEIIRELYEALGLKFY